jgi:hypothetical protein
MLIMTPLLKKNRRPKNKKRGKMKDKKFYETVWWYHRT